MAVADRAAAADRAATLSDSLILLADQCVQCGLCQPHCPTYSVARSEADSPRGRIALARALAEGRVDMDSSAGLHLDRCLACRRCERVCPSQVRYGDLLQLARQQRPARAPSVSRLMPLLARPWRLRVLARLAGWTRAPRWLPRLASAIAPRARLLRWLRELPDLPQAPRPSALARSLRAPSRGCIALLAGCVASAYDHDTLAATQSLLQALGYDVAVPRGQGCCGALAYHSGRIHDAQALATRTRHALLAARPQAVLVTASGCCECTRDLTLADQPVAVYEALTFLAQDDNLPSLRFRPLARTAALHVPCTQAGIAGSMAATRRLLGLIPQLQLKELSQPPYCCGASGSYFLDHPEFAEPLRAAKLDEAAALEPDMVLSANIGCRLYLDNGLRQRGSALRVRHPLSLLAQQLE
jgi:glycolate oxidase iron-sulfur subunit